MLTHSMQRAMESCWDPRRRVYRGGAERESLSKGLAGPGGTT